MNKRGFASDNNAGVHPAIIEAILSVNQGHTIGYGDDPYTARAVKTFREQFGEQVEVFFVFLGTGANVLGLQAATSPFHSIICAGTAHIQEDECGAPERFTGCKLLPVDTPDGKLMIEGIEKHYKGIGFEHHSQPRVVSITQATEMGTVYSPEEIRTITRWAHERNMVVHMDGARIANAAVHLGCSLREMTGDAGIDVLSFGGTKNGLMYGEAVVFFDPALAGNFKYIRKQGMQLASKMRYISVQFDRLLQDDLWKKNAAHANRMASMLAERVEEIPGISLTQKVQANGVFAIVPGEIIEPLQKEYFFYEWDEDRNEVRWMTSFDTTEEDVTGFVALLKKLLGETPQGG